MHAIPLLNASFEKTVGSGVFVIGILIAIDVFGDLREGVAISHVLLEGISFLFCLAVVVYLIWNSHQQQSLRYQDLNAHIKTIETDRDQWRQQASAYIEGLGTAIENQFSAWGCSESERDIGFLILKGLSHKEIATIRQTSEKTVRQQATMLYAKSGMAGKGDLFSFFLEDLMAPRARTL